jgi:photosystem II stability/assembly factor-like uncharacterized protein
LVYSGPFNLNSVFFIDDNTGWTVGDYNWSMQPYRPGILYTVDGGQTWTVPATLPSFMSSEACNAVHFADAQNGWVVGMDYGYGSVIIKSTDGGASWANSSNGATSSLFGVHAFSSQSAIAVGINGTLIKTTDGGSSWSVKVSNAMDHLFGVCFIDDNTGWAAGDYDMIAAPLSNLVKTSDGGETWTAIECADLVDVDINGIHFVNNTDGWIIGDIGGGDEQVVFKSIDGGITWKKIQNYSGYGNAIFGFGKYEAITESYNDVTSYGPHKYYMVLGQFIH